MNVEVVLKYQSLDSELFKLEKGLKENQNKKKKEKKRKEKKRKVENSWLRG